MSETDTDNCGAPAVDKKAELARKLAVGSWGLFFIWVAITLVANVGWGIALLGVGIITLATQAVRKCVGLPAEWFWLVVGVLFLAGGICELRGVPMPVVPILLALAGVALLASALCGKRCKCE